MATRLQVSCINKRDHPNPHERIQAIGGAGSIGPWKWSEEMAIFLIEAGTYAYFVNVGGKPVDVTVATHIGRKYLKTTADGYEPNNLLSLPGCR